MSTIDEIMSQADDYADAERALGGVLADECDQLRRNMLRLLLEGAVAAALADAERKGAERMREAAAGVCDLNHFHCIGRRDSETGDSEDQYQAEMAKECAQEIRALPLPTGSKPTEEEQCKWHELANKGVLP